MSAPTLHLLKLCVGAAGIDDLRDWQSGRIAAQTAAGEDPRPVHVTRMWPRRGDEILAGGGSLFWVFQGLILARQRIAALEQVRGEDGIQRCGIRFEPEIVAVEARPRRPFQGWRYLAAKDAPADLPGGADVPDMPDHLRRALAEIGVLSG